MEKNYTEKEEFKTIQSNRTESNFQTNPYQTQTYQFKNRIDYSKKINTKNMETITKFFAKDKMLIETSVYRHDYNILNILKKRKKVINLLHLEKICKKVKNQMFKKILKECKNWKKLKLNQPKKS